MFQVFMDGSKDHELGTTEAAVFIPQLKKLITKRKSDHLEIYSVELFNWGGL